MMQENYLSQYWKMNRVILALIIILPSCWKELEKLMQAIKVYEKGMEEAKKVGDDHSLSELRSAFEELTF